MIMGSSKVTDIHEQHHVLAEKVRTVCTILRNPSEIDDLKDDLDDLVGYLQAHNEEEEKLMGSYNYQRLELHEREHQNLLSRLLSLREKVYVSVEEQQKQELLGFLETELTKHINEDLRLGLFPITTMPGGVE
jgi:hemerythrin-like metal-binding protein